MFPAGLPTLSQKTAARFIVDQLFDRGGMIGFGETDGDSLALQNVCEQSVSSAVKLRDRYDIGTEFDQVRDRVVDRRLPAAGAERLHSAFERRHAAFQHRGGRISDTGVAKTFGFEIEQRRSVVGAIERIGRGLINGHGHGFGGRVDLIATVNGHGFSFHAVSLMKRFICCTMSAISVSCVR